MVEDRKKPPCEDYCPMYKEYGDTACMGCCGRRVNPQEQK